MSELKAINAYQLTTNTEDSDVYIHNDEFGCGGDLVECYLKSEADKILVEKDKKIAELNDKLRHYPMMAALIEGDNKKIRRLKRALYKACANWALSTLAWLDCIDQGEPRKWSEMRQRCLKKAEEYK